MNIREAIVTRRCVQTWRAFGACVACGATAADPAHLAGTRLLCADCCCGAGLFSELPAEAFDRAGQPAVQEALF